LGKKNGGAGDAYGVVSVVRDQGLLKEKTTVQSQVSGSW